MGIQHEHANLEQTHSNQPDVADINGEPRLDITKDQISFSAVSGT